MSHIVDLSHLIEAGMVTYPGLPGPVISDHLSRAASRDRYPAGTEFQIGAVTLIANTGTYLDTPFHRYPDGVDLSGIDLGRLADIPGVVIDATRAGRAVGPELFDGVDVTGRAVLIHTGWNRHWRTPGYGAAEHPFVTAALVDWLIEQRPALVGIDSVNIDDMADWTRPAHTGLLGAGIPVVEHLHNLHELLNRDFRFHAAPVPIAGMGSFPIRAYAVTR